MEQWFSLVSQPCIEYSTDYDFFVKNQIAVWKSGNKYEYNSRIESKCFKEERAVFGNYEFSEEHIEKTCKQIHKEILEGKHGAGILVN